MKRVTDKAKNLLFPLSSKKLINPFKMYAIKMLTKTGAMMPPKK